MTTINVNISTLETIIERSINKLLEPAIKKTLEPTFKIIFTKLDSIDTRLTNVEDRLTKVENDIYILKQDVNILKQDVKVLKDYNANESSIKEQRDAQALKSYLLDHNHGANITIIKFGNFYKPYDNNPLTDIDGCVIFRNIPVKTKYINGKNVILDNSCVYLIESKHGITKTILDKKLKQFAIILDLIHKVQTDKYIPRKKKFKFDQMIDTNNIKQWPANIKILFSTDKMTPTVIKLITAITTDTLTDELYTNIIFDTIMTHSIMRDIHNSANVDNYVKKLLNMCNNLEDLFKIMYPMNPIPDLNEKQMTIMEFVPQLESLLVPKSIYSEIIPILKGKLGFINNDDIQLPESLTSHGFNSKNKLLNLTINH